MLLVLLFGSVAVDDEDLEFGDRWVLVRFFDKVCKRLHEALAGRAVLGSVEDENMSSGGMNHGFLHANLLVRVESFLDRGFLIGG